MVTLPDALGLLYPAADPAADYRLSDTGAGPFIASWSAVLGPPPTPQQLAAVTPEQVQAAAVGRRVAEAGGLLAAGADPVSIGVRCALRVLTDRLNVRLRALGADPILEAELLPAMAAGMSAGLGLPGPRTDGG